LKFSAATSWIRVFTALLVSVIFLATPVAEAHHSHERPAEACETSDVSADHAPADAPDHSGHTHHSHKCGSCHVHVFVGAFAGSDQLLKALSVKTRLPGAKSLPRGVAADLLCPPNV